MFRNKSVDLHQFAMVPKADIPRSKMRMEKTLKSTFDAGYLNPVFVEEVLPGDTFQLSMTAFCRMATPIFPVMDNLYLDSFFFFVPNRLVWDNWEKFMGQQTNPGDSISYVVPQIVSPAGGYTLGGVYDMMGLPTVGQVDGASTISHSALPMRAYSRIYNDWFRDENLQNSISSPTDDGPDTYSIYFLQRRGKRHDYFTGCLPFVQKGTSVSLPLGTSAPVVGDGTAPTFNAGAGAVNLSMITGNTNAQWSGAGATAVANWSNPHLVADLSAATAATINQIRQAFQIQKLLERDARGGTRYTEIVRSHFGVISPDARLQRTEYLGGGTTSISVNPIAQTSGTGVTGSTTPIATLSSFATALAQGHGFHQSFTEHGYVIGIVSVRADLTYQQGMRRHWSRSTRYDFYFPVFAALGEQAVLNKEIYCTGLTGDNSVFGYQERWAEYRYLPSEITCYFRSTASGTIDPWHLAQKFTSLPTLNSTFIVENPPISRVVAVGTGSNAQQFLFDAFFQLNAARPLPMYSVPGLIDHF